MPDDDGPADLLARNTAEYTVIPVPHTWRVHEECIDLRTPRVEDLRTIRSACRGRRLTDEQLESETGIPRQRVTYMRKSLKPVEEWELRPRLAPGAPGLVPAWDWIGSGRTEQKKEAREEGHKQWHGRIVREDHEAQLRRLYGQV
jgi:hypothetical protein